MNFILGVILSVGSIRASMYFLDQNFGMYFDDVALAIVVGCTLAVSIITLPWKQWRLLLSSLRKLFISGTLDQEKLVKDSLDFIQGVGNVSYNPPNIKHLAYEVLRDGKELIELHFSPEEIESILQERVHQSGERKTQISSGFTALAKYPPAFGLIGTVFGLVNLMRAISEGLDPSQTGVKMAVALVATLYGLVIANLVVAPIAESIAKQGVDERHLADISLQAVLLASQKTSILKSQEMLNSFVPENKRVNFIKSAMEVDEAA